MGKWKGHGPLDMGLFKILNLGAPVDPDDAVRLQDLIAYAPPLDATYITQTPSGVLTGEQALSALNTGLLKSTTGTGVVSIGLPGIDFADPAMELIAGDGMVGGGFLGPVPTLTFDVVANPDGSIVVNDDNIQVGIINSDQHGFLIGGLLHATATVLDPGFMDSTDKATLINSTIVVTSAVDKPNNAVDLGLLTSGILKQTVAAGVATISIAAEGTDFGNVETVADGIAIGTIQLEDVVITTLNTGHKAWVQSVRDFFVLDKTSTVTADGITVVTAFGGTGRWHRLNIPDVFWTIQSTWTIDPASGSDEAVGSTLAPLKTRSEFYRRLKGVTLKQSITITINSSLDAGDNYVSDIHSQFDSAFTESSINWVGVPVSLFSGTITGYTARSGATSQPTLMTIASIPTSWTASGLVDKIIEYSDGVGGFVRATVVADMGSKTAWISPPINQSNNQTAVFAIGQTVNVYEMPSLPAAEIITTEISNYKYLHAPRWIMKSGRAFCTNCTGFVSQFGGSFAWINCFSGEVDGSAVNIVAGHCTAYSGKNRYIVSDGGLFFKSHATVMRRGLHVEGNGTISTGGQSSGFSDIEYYSTNVSSALAYVPVNQGGTIICGGYVYGTAVDTSVVRFEGRDGTVSFSQVPVITGATLVTFGLAGTTKPIADIANTMLQDQYNNRVIGPFGASNVDNTLYFANIAALASYSIVGLVKSRQAYVETVKDFFYLDTTSAETADAISIVTALGGTGRWIRTNFAHPYWATQLTWYWDPVAGNDENDGITLGTPFKTHEEFYRRTLNLAFASSVRINVLSNVPNQTFRHGCTALSVRYQAALTPLGTGTLTGVTTVNKASNQPWEITDSALATSWTASGFTNKYLVAKSGATVVGTAWIDKDLGSKTARMGPVTNTQPLLTPGSVGAVAEFSITDGTFAVGNTYTVYDMPFTWAIPRHDFEDVTVFFYGFKFPQATSFNSNRPAANPVISACIFTSGTVSVVGRLQAWQCLFLGFTFASDCHGGLWTNNTHHAEVQFQASKYFVIQKNIHVSNGGFLGIKRNIDGGYNGGYGDIALFDVDGTKNGLAMRHHVNWQSGYIWGKDNTTTAAMVILGVTNTWLYAGGIPTVVGAGSDFAINTYSGYITGVWADIGAALGSGITTLSNSGLMIGGD